jgi:hypothetical protein
MLQEMDRRNERESVEKKKNRKRSESPKYILIYSLLRSGLIRPAWPERRLRLNQLRRCLGGIRKRHDEKM